MNQPTETTPKQRIQILKAIHSGMLLMLISILGFAYYTQQTFVTELDYTKNPMLIIVPIVAILGYFLSQWLFNQQINKIDKRKSIQENWDAYQTATIIKYALIEGPILVAIFSYFKYPHAMYLTIAVFMILYLFTQRPTMDKVNIDLS